MLEIKKLPEETEEQFLWKVGQLVDSGKIENWASINDIVNTELGIEEEKWRDESSFRKRYQAAKSFYNNCFSKMESDTYANEVSVMKRELERAKIQYRDERNAWQKQNYITARVEQKLDYLEDELKNLGKINFEEHKKPIINGTNEMVICLSDLHIGQTFSSIFGEYNIDIAKRRLSQYLNVVRENASLYNVKKAHIIGLGDLISGNIHITIQVSNRENVIEQIKTATELISSFCYECTKIFETVQFSNVSGNHSRVTKKDEAIHSERLDDVIGWAIDLSLSHIENFRYMKHRNLDTGIADLNICGNSYLAVHGDFDNMNKSGVSNLCMMLGFTPTGIFRGHLHYPAFEDINGVKVIQSGSLAGCGDDYTIEKRLNGKPCQTICICDNKGIKVHIPVELN